jgi:hypothetical protein
MNVGELIAQLQRLNPNTEVAVLDGFNGGGQPRALNFGPALWDEETLEEMADFDMPPDYSDLKSMPGMPIVVLGYGCY